MCNNTLLIEGQWDIDELNIDYKKLSEYRYKVKVGVIDSGVDINHPGIHNICKYKSFIDSDYLDSLGHGTMIVGQIAGCGLVRGIMNNAELYIYKILNVVNKSNISLLIDAIEEAIKDDVDIINMSIGLNIPEHALNTDEYKILQQLIKDATDKGVFCVSSSGYSSSNFHIPSCLEDVISVQALGRMSEIVNESIKASYILPGGNYLKRTPNELISVYVPCQNASLLDLPNGYSLFFGESLSASKMTGIIGLLLEQYPVKSREEKINRYRFIIKKLEENSIDVCGRKKINISKLLC